MSLHITQNHAARVVHAVRLSEPDVQRLVAEFGLHPLDAERLLNVPERSTIDRYRDYVVVALVLPWPGKNGLVGVDIRLIIGSKFFMAIGDTPADTVKNILADLNSDRMVSCRPAGIAAMVLDGLSSVLTERPVAFDPRTELTIKNLITVMDRLPNELTMAGVSFSKDESEQFALARHLIKNGAAKNENRVVGQPTIKHRERALATSYLAASAAILLITLLFRP